MTGPDKAALLRARIKAGRGGLLAQLELIQTLIAGGDASAALEEAREAALLNPGVAAAVLALGEALFSSHNLPAAIGEFQRALRIDPEMKRARYLMGCAWLEAGEADKAIEIFARLAPDEASGLNEMRTRAERMRTADRSDPGYVRHLFDQFSADYEDRMLGQLHYSAHETLHALASLVMPGRAALGILDLGCGTGLAGALFKPDAARLDGIDLSPKMIEKARARGIYDSLTVGDIETALARPGPRYDLMLAADTLVYLGDLQQVFAGVAGRLAPGGYFLFTVEKKDGDGFTLGPKRRWHHSKTYLRQAAARAGLEFAGLNAATPRTEAGEPVEGLAVSLCAP